MQAQSFKLTVLFIFALCFSVNAQKTISRGWTSFAQSIEVKTERTVKFKLTGKIKVISEDPNGVAGLWVRVDNKNKETGFFDNMMDRPATSASYQEYSINGTFDAQAKTLNIGGLCIQNGAFYFDDFKLFLENEEGQLVEAPIANASFEKSTSAHPLQNWSSGIAEGQQVKVKEYSLDVTADAASGAQALLIKGEGATPARPMEIVAEDGFTPQMGVLVSMLDAMKERVEGAVSGHSVYELDYLMDDKANSIGALIYHLAAAEKLYQVLTFEGRFFNEEEEAKWGAALDLGDLGREQIKGKTAQYYLDLYNDVRAETKKELAKRDDTWLQEEIPGAGMTNFYGWFHVMEHQSSHLGQILLLQKRIKPEEKEEEILPAAQLKN